MLFASDALADRKVDRLALALEARDFSPRTSLIPSASAAVAIRLSASSSRSTEAGATLTLTTFRPSTVTSPLIEEGFALRSWAIVRSTIGFAGKIASASMDDASSRAFSRAAAISSGSARSSPAAIVILSDVPAFALGSGVCLTALPAAFFAHHPSGGFGIWCFLQIL